MPIKYVNKTYIITGKESPETLWAADQAMGWNGIKREHDSVPGQYNYNFGDNHILIKEGGELIIDRKVLFEPEQFEPEPFMDETALLILLVLSELRVKQPGKTKGKRTKATELGNRKIDI
jgi:hypothetical protein